MPNLLSSRKRIMSVPATALERGVREYQNSLWRWSQIMRWWFVCMTQELSDSPLALRLERGKTSSVRCEEHAYYLFSTRRVVCYELVPRGQTVNQHYHIDTLWWLGGMWRLAIGFCTITIHLPIVLSLFMSSWLETKCHFMCTFLPRFSACESLPSPPFPKKKVVLKRRKLNDRDSNKICRMHLPSFKWCASQNISNGGAITELTAESTK